MPDDFTCQRETLWAYVYVYVNKLKIRKTRNCILLQFNSKLQRQMLRVQQ